MPPDGSGAAPQGRGRWPAGPAIYEIYPRSFRDTTGSGEGDLAGIVRGLDHVASLGVDGIWIAPFFVSPLADGGYDVADHATIDPRYGSDAEFDALVARAHALGLCVLIDQVLNHTSCEHRWFRESSAGRCEYDDYYVWRDPKPDGSPPNNWRSFFGPPAWTWEHRRRQYYLHQFLACQPSLNLRHPEVKAAHERQIEHWRSRGVDGFRFDAVTAFLYDESLADNPPASEAERQRMAVPPYNPYAYQDHVNDMLPGNGSDYACDLRAWAGEDAWLIGEVNSGNCSVELARAFCGPDKLDAGYTIDLPDRGATAEVVEDVLRRLEGARTCAWWLTSHDQPRQATAAGDGSPRDVRFLAFLLSVLPGPRLIYQGEELGLPQPRLARDEVTDPFDLLYWPDGPGREGPRVPIPWVEGLPARGFTTGDPWLPMRWEDGVSVAAQADDGGSALAFHRRLLAFRREAGLGGAEVTDVSREGERLTVRMANGCDWLAAFNFGGKPAPRPGGINAAPAFESSPVDGVLPPRTGAIWRL